MGKIQVLDQITIDKIAAGEVIERPASIVKELVENAIDAGASNIVVEIQDGGSSFIRITDNGSGITREDIRSAFLRHSTSKIRQVEDLSHILSLGFRGEALSSIAAVAKVELISKTEIELIGSRYLIEGGQEQGLEDIGAPKGSTFYVRHLFYNLPARRKFLKSFQTEAGHIQDLLLRLALSHPHISFLFKNNGQEKLRTSGNGKLKETIYQLYGREIAGQLLPLEYSKGDLKISGFIGKPALQRGNRNYETFFVNGRYIKNTMIAKAVEEAYKDFVMTHKFPFVVLNFHVSGEMVDINVHPTKMELRFQKQQDVYATVYEAVHRHLLEPELIPTIQLEDPVNPKDKNLTPQKEESPFLLKPKAESLLGINAIEADGVVKGIQEEVSYHPQPVVPPLMPQGNTNSEEYFLEKMRQRVTEFHQSRVSVESNLPEESKRTDEAIQLDKSKPSADTLRLDETEKLAAKNQSDSNKQSADSKQLHLFEDTFLKREMVSTYTLIGQLFYTYWLVEFQERLFIVDQHAAHERVLYEQILLEFQKREPIVQSLNPPIVLPLNMQESALLQEHLPRFKALGFEIEHFGGEEYVVRGVPANVFSIAKKELLLEMLDSLLEGLTPNTALDAIDKKIALHACKGAVKGKQILSAIEVEALLTQLLQLENPYHCPHGRPTIIAMSKTELEKKFKRIV